MANVKVGDGYIRIKPVLDKTDLAKVQAEAKAAFQRSVSEQLGFQKTANNQFLEASRKLNAQKDKDQAASGKRQLDSLRNSIASQVALEKQKSASMEKDQKDLLSRIDRDRKSSTQESAKAERAAFRDLEKGKTRLSRAGDAERSRNSESSSKSLASRIRNFQTFTPSFLPAAIGGVAALPAALGTLSNLLPVVTAGLAILPTLFASTAVSVGILGVALHGVTGAWSALDTAQAGASSGAALSAKQLAAAQKTVRNDTEALSKAQRDARQSTLDQKDAQDALNQSYIDAANNLADLDLRQKRNQLDLLDAQDAQVQAQQGLINAQSTGNPAVIAQAQRALDEANQSLQEQRQQIKENTQENDKAVAKGVKGSDQVTQAQKALKDANQAVIDSQQHVRDATEDLATAQKELADQLSGASGAAKSLNNALNALSPNARKVVVALHDALGQGSAFALGIQDAFFAPFVSGDVVKKISGLVDQLKGPLDDAARAIGGTVAGILGSFADPKAAAGLKGILDGIKGFFTNVTPGLKLLNESFAALSGKGGALGGSVGTFISGLLTQFSGFLDKVDIKGLFESAKPVIKSVFNTIKDLAGTLGDLFKVAGQTNFLSIFEQLSKTLHDFTSSKEGQAALTALFRALNDIGGGVTKVLAEALGIIGQVLIAASPYIGPFVDALVGLLQTLAPLAKPLGDLAGLILLELTTALEDLTPVIGPLIDAFSDFLHNYLDDAITLFQEFVDLLPDLKPLFKEIEGAIAILLPPALRLTDQFFKAAGDQLPGLVTSFGQLLAAVLPLVTPVSQLLSLFLTNPVGLAIFKGALEAITIAWGGLAAVIKSVIDAYNAVARVIHLPTITTPPEAKAIIRKPVQSFGPRGYADGGFTGEGGKFQPAGIVHAGEYVLPSEMSGLFPAMETLRTGLKGYSSGGPVSSLLGLAPPLLRDSGGTVPPGLSLVANHTGKHETIRTAGQEKALGGGDTYVTVMIDGQEFQGRIDTTIEKRERKLGKQLQGK